MGRIEAGLDGNIFTVTAIDPHVHLRDFGESDKEDLETGTLAALAGGYCAVLDMPNNMPPIINSKRIKTKLERAGAFVNSYYGAYLGGTNDNQQDVYEASCHAVGLKLYLNQTHGDLQINDEALKKHFESWPSNKPICTHAEGVTVEKVLKLCAKYQKPVHICHVSEGAEIEMIKAAKEIGLPVTCEVTPHHLLLTDDDASALGNLGYVKPELRPRKDVEALWKNIDVIDCLATDHAPHTLNDKRGKNPTPGFPGLETAIPLMLTAITDGKLSMERLVDMVYTNPKRIFNLPDLGVTYAKFDLSETYLVDCTKLKTKCGWSPFALTGHKLTGRITEVCIKSEVIYRNGKFLGRFGKNRYSSLVFNYKNGR